MAAVIPPESRSMPVREGDCIQTRITEIGGRLEGDKSFESGSGRMYTTTTLRTHGTWSLPNSEHMCGDA